MQDYVYTRDNNVTKEAVVVDKNSGKTIASFSCYIANLMPDFRDREKRFKG